MGVLAFAGILAVSSCQQDDFVGGEVAGDYVDVTFTVSTADGINTRATIGNGTKANKVACTVYDANGDELDLYAVVDVQADKTAQYNVRLAKGQAYRAVFFAYYDNGTTKYYNVDDLKKVEVLGNQLSNVEERDAFTGVYDITPEASINSIVTEPIVLKRPLAQLNLGIDATELEAARKSGVVIEQSYVKVNNVYNTFNAYDSKVVGESEYVEFAMNAIPGEALEIDLNNDNVIEDSEKFTYLALNYLLVGDLDAEKTLTDVEFQWTSVDGKKNEPTTNFVNIRAQRNYRTNIIGKLITNPAEFNLVIDERFDGQYVEDIPNVVTKTVKTAAELQDAIDAADASCRTYIKIGRSNIAGDFVVNQKKDVEILIDAQNQTFFGTFTVNGGSNWGNKEALTLQNFKFAPLSTPTRDIITIGERTADNSSRYAHNVTIKDCTFAKFGNSANVSSLVCIRAYQANDVTVVNCKAEKDNTSSNNYHSFAQITGGTNVKFEGNTIKLPRAISLGAATNCLVSNCNIEATKYGIRHNADSKVDVLNIDACTINAAFPVVVRKENTTTVESYEVAFRGVNTLTGAVGYDVAIANEEYEAAGQALTPIANTTVSGAATSWSIFK